MCQRVSTAARHFFILLGTFCAVTQNDPKWPKNDPHFFRIFYDWIGGSANFFAFRMYELNEFEDFAETITHWLVTGWATGIQEMPEHLKINCGAGGELHKVTPLAFNQMHSYWKLTMMMAMLMLWTTKNFSFSRPAGGPALHLIIQDTDRNMNPLQHNFPIRKLFTIFYLGTGISWSILCIFSF